MKRTTLYAVAAIGLVMALLAAATILPGYATPAEKGLGADEAKAIALRKADVTETQVTELQVKTDTEQGVSVYDVEFKYDGQEYDYEINAQTGAIVDEKITPDDDVVNTNNTNTDTKGDTTSNKDTAANNTADTSNAATNNNNTNANTGTLTREEALAVALKDAGVQEADIYHLETELDWEDDHRVQVYEIEFDCNGQEYQYEINAETGAILKRELEAAPTANTAAGDATLTQDEAVAIACEDAGVKQDAITRLKVESDWDDGILTYEIEFYQDTTEYDYEIHGATGQILEQEQDHHHH